MVASLAMLIGLLLPAVAESGQAGQPDNASLPLVESVFRAAGGRTICVALGTEDGAWKVARVAVE